MGAVGFSLTTLLEPDDLLCLLLAIAPAWEARGRTRREIRPCRLMIGILAIRRSDPEPPKKHLVLAEKLLGSLQAPPRAGVKILGSGHNAENRRVLAGFAEP